MDSFMSLGAPLKQFTTCMSGKNTSTKRGTKKNQSVRRSSFTRRKSINRRRSLPCNSQKVPDSWLRVYQDELKRERKRQQAMMAKKNAERTVRRTHFRSHHCLPRVSNHSTDPQHSYINSSFTPQHTNSTKKPAPVKDDAFFGAFQGLSLDGLMGSTGGSPAVAPSSAGDQCIVM